jgi:hypothetical protein
MTRNTFVSELDTLKQEVKELGKKVENTFRAVVKRWMRMKGRNSKI